MQLKRVTLHVGGKRRPMKGPFIPHRAAPGIRCILAHAADIFVREAVGQALPRLYSQHGFLLVFLLWAVSQKGGSLAGASQHNREIFFPFIFLVMLLPWLWACRNQPKESCKNIADMSWPNSWCFFQLALSIITIRLVDK